MTDENLIWYFKRFIKDEIKKGKIKCSCKDCWLNYYLKLNDFYMNK